MPLPDLDPEQRRAALRKAAQARRLRVEAKEMLKAGELTLGEVLERAGGDDALANMRVSELLEALPNTGRARARQLMDAHGIAPGRRLRGLGRHQRAALLADFPAP